MQGPAKMTKKKNAMTLKDFHGGSIPSDLPLPSAPGMTVDRSTYERQTSGAWMSPTLGRGYGVDRAVYHRQSSSNGIRTFEDKTAFFPNPANIGRNYDEDERKPVDTRPRSSHSTDRYEDFEERRGGAYSVDRYILEEQGNFSSAVSGFSDSRNSSDRFPPSQVGGTAFESDNYVHDEFGLIPVGPLPPRASSRDSHGRQQPSAYQQDLAHSPPEHLQYSQPQQMTSGSHLQSQQHLTSSPPKSWRNVSQQQQSGLGGSGSSTNVWTARRDNDVNRVPTSESSLGEIQTSSPWRPQSTTLKIADASAVDKVSSGRWQSDSTRLSSSMDRRQPPASVAELTHESRAPLQVSYSSGYSADSGKGQHHLDSQPSLEGSRNIDSQDSERIAYSTDAIQGSLDESGRSAYGASRRVGFGSGVKGAYPDQGQGDFQDRGGFSDATTGGSFSERLSSRSTYQDSVGKVGYAGEVGRRSFSEDRWSGSGSSGFHETERGSHVDTGGIRFQDGSKGAYSEARGPVEQGLGTNADRIRRPTSSEGEFVESSKDVRAGLAYSARPGMVSSGRGTSIGYSDRRRFSEDGQVPHGSDGGQISYPESDNLSASGHAPESVKGGEDYGLVHYPSGSARSFGSGQGIRAGATAESSLPTTVALVQERTRGSYSPERTGALLTDDVRPSSGSENNEPFYSTSMASAHLDSGKSVATSTLERPKLNLKPRSRPLEKSETLKAIAETVAGYEESSRVSTEKRPLDVISGEPVLSDGMVGNDINKGKMENDEELNRPAERPKLNLKPRSQAPDVVTENGSEKLRQSVFGGARPRELVLKERGVDDPVSLESLTPPLSNSLSALVSSASKPDHHDGMRFERHESWSDRQEKPFDRQGSNKLLERQDSNRGDRAPDSQREYERKDSRRDLERPEGRRTGDRFDSRRESERQDARKDQDSRRDIDKQESWRQTVESSVVSMTSVPKNPNSSVSSLVDSSPRTPGRYGYSSTATAVELAQAFSRSTSIGSSTPSSRGVGSQRLPGGPVSRSQSHGASQGNGVPVPFGSRDAPFSRLAEAPPTHQLLGRDTYSHGGGFGSDSQMNSYGGGKLGSYGSGDLNMIQSFGRSEIATVRDRLEENDDFPGKRGLPLRQKEGYYE